MSRHRMPPMSKRNSQVRGGFGFANFSAPTPTTDQSPLTASLQTSPIITASSPSPTSPHDLLPPPPDSPIGGGDDDGGGSDEDNDSDNETIHRQRVFEISVISSSHINVIADGSRSNSNSYSNSNNNNNENSERRPSSVRSWKLDIDVSSDSGGGGGGGGVGGGVGVLGTSPAIEEVQIDTPDNIEDVSRLIAMPARYIARRHSAGARRETTTSSISVASSTGSGEKAAAAAAAAAAATRPSLSRVVKSHDNSASVPYLPRHVPNNSRLSLSQQFQQQQHHIQQMLKQPGRACSRDGCTNCESEFGAFMVCSGCGTAPYCSRQCQEIHYNVVHKHICPGARQRRLLRHRRSQTDTNAATAASASAQQFVANATNNHGDDNDDDDCPPPLVDGKKLQQEQLQRTSLVNDDRWAYAPPFIRMVLFDFDKTILKVHTHGYYVGDLDDLVAQVSTAWLDLVPVLLARRLYVGIVSFSDEHGKTSGNGVGGERLIKSLLTLAFHHHLSNNNNNTTEQHDEPPEFARERTQAIMSKIHIVAASPQIRNELPEFRHSPMPYSKAWHTEKILSRVRLMGDHIQPHQVLLFDDSKQNVRHAVSAGMQGWAVSANTAFTEQSWQDAVASLARTTKFSL